MKRRLPPIESLRVLEASVRHVSYSRAAEELGVTPAAVSARMRDLEAELGVRLFVRSGPRIEPTDAARALAGKLSTALAIMRDGVEACRAEAHILRVTAVPSLAVRWLTPRLARLHPRAEMPPIRLDVSTALADPDSFDIAIRTGEGPWPGFDAHRLFPVEATPMLNPQLARGVAVPADLARLSLLPHRDWRRWFDAAGAGSLDLTFAADNYPTHEMNAAAALEGAGVALLSPRLYAQHLAEGRLVQPFSRVLTGPAWHHVLVKAGDCRPNVKAFIDWLVHEDMRSDGEENPSHEPGLPIRPQTDLHYIIRDALGLD
jgi:LysR family glycine cleavage system transcriptional activator